MMSHRADRYGPAKIRQITAAVQAMLAHFAQPQDDQPLAAGLADPSGAASAPPAWASRDRIGAVDLQLARLADGGLAPVGADDAQLVPGRHRPALGVHDALFAVGRRGKADQPLGHAEDLLQLAAQPGPDANHIWQPAPASPQLLKRVWR